MNDVELMHAVDLYLDYQKNIKSYSLNTTEAYGSDLRQWVEFIEENELNWRSPSRQEINRFFSNLRPDLVKRSQARKVTALKSFYRFCERSGFIDKKPAFSAPRYKKGLPHPIRTISLERLLDDDSRQKNFIQLRDRALLELLYSTGLRVSEVLSLRVRDVTDLQGKKENFEIFNQVKINGKGNKERVVFIGESAALSLNSYLSALIIEGLNDADSFLVQNFKGKPLSRRGVNYILKKRLQSLSIDEEHSAHSIRHTFATDLINNGADIRHVQEMLGHSSLSTTQNYIAVAKERLQHTFRQAHPHAKLSQEKHED